jgi:alpha-1,2-mannosyltransferase
MPDLSRPCLAKAWLPGVVFLIAALIYVPTAATRSASVDVIGNAALSMQLASHGNPWLEDTEIPSKDGTTLQPLAVDGHLTLGRTPGQVWAAVPAYRIAHQAKLSVAPGNITAALLTALTMMFLFMSVRRALGTGTALVGTAVIGLTTPVWSVDADALWTHCVTLLGIAIAAWASSQRRGWTAGVGYAVGMLGRPHLGIIAAAHGIMESVRTRSVLPAVRIGVPTSIAVGVLCLWNHFAYGFWGPNSYGGGSVTALIPGQKSAITEVALNMAGLLVSPSRGLLVWTPALLIMLPAVVRSWRTQPPWTRQLALGGCLYAVAQSSVDGFTGGNAFYGYRLALEPLLCFAPLVICSWPHVRRAGRLLMAPVIGLQFAVILVGSLGSGAAMDQTPPFVWVPNSFVELVRGDPGYGALSLVSFAIGTAVLATLISRSRKPREPSPSVPSLVAR